MAETVESIKNYGILNPALVRPRAEGGYELIAGHRRKRGCELAGKSKMPVLIRNYTDDEAVIVMVDSNIQRESLLAGHNGFSPARPTPVVPDTHRSGGMPGCWLLYGVPYPYIFHL